MVMNTAAYGGPDRVHAASPKNRLLSTITVNSSGIAASKNPTSLPTFTYWRKLLVDTLPLVEHGDALLRTSSPSSTGRKASSSNGPTGGSLWRPIRGPTARTNTLVTYEGTDGAGHGVLLQHPKWVQEQVYAALQND